MMGLEDASHSTRPLGVALIGFPYDESSSFQRGTAAAPPLIRRALHVDSSNLWSETLIDLGAEGVLHDVGDVDCGGRESVRGNIEAAIAWVLSRGLVPISLGGDHSITYPIVKTFRRTYPRLSLLQLDAHPDLYAEFDGDRYSHACPFARIMEEGLVDRLVQVGVRTMNGHQREQAEGFGVEVIDMRAWFAGLHLTFASPLYVSIDLDVLDPAFAPGVSHPEPGGLSMRDVIGVIQAIGSPIVGADLVEYNPSNDPLGLTGRVCAKLLKELAAKMVG